MKLFYKVTKRYLLYSQYLLKCNCKRNGGLINDEIT